MKINMLMGGALTAATAVAVSGAMWFGGADGPDEHIAGDMQSFSNAPVVQAPEITPVADRAAVEAAVNLAMAARAADESSTLALAVDVVDAPVILTSAAETPLAPETDGHEKGVLCAVWALQRIGAKIGYLDAGEALETADNYPVPAPVWLLHRLQHLG